MKFESYIYEIVVYSIAKMSSFKDSYKYTSDDADEISVWVMRGDAEQAVEAVRDTPQQQQCVDHMTGNTTMHYLLRKVETPAQENALYAAVEELLSKGADPCAKNKRGQTPLFFANNVRIFKQLIKAATQRGMSETEYVGDGISKSGMLVAAASTGNVDLVELLLAKYGADPLVPSNATFPIHVACNKQVASLLVEAVRKRDPGLVSEYVNQRNYLGRTPLHLCSGSQLAAFLVEQGADVNAKDMTADEFWSREDVKGRKPENRIADPAAMLDLTQHNRADIPLEVWRAIRSWQVVADTEVPASRSPLAYALLGRTPDSLELVQLLLDAGASPNAVDDEGLTPEQFGCKYGATYYLPMCDAMAESGWSCAYTPSEQTTMLDAHVAALRLASVAAAAADKQVA